MSLSYLLRETSSINRTIPIPNTSVNWIDMKMFLVMLYFRSYSRTRNITIMFVISFFCLWYPYEWNSISSIIKSKSCFIYWKYEKESEYVNSNFSSISVSIVVIVIVVIICCCFIGAFLYIRQNNQNLSMEE